MLVKMNSTCDRRSIHRNAAPFLAAILLSLGVGMHSQDLDQPTIAAKGIKQRSATTTFPTSTTIRMEISLFDRDGWIQEKDFRVYRDLAAVDAGTTADTAKHLYLYQGDGPPSEISHYDGKGERGKETLSYDEAGRTIETTSYDVNGYEYYRTELRYDEGGRLAREDFLPNSGENTYTVFHYGKDGRLESDESFVRDTGQSLSRGAYSYDQDGRLSEFSNQSLTAKGQGTRILYRYDGKGLLSESRHFDLRGKTERLTQTIEVYYSYYCNIADGRPGR
jgi:antitoxin component YwqK of YwqJK toxin-antitoxin module